MLRAPWQHGPAASEVGPVIISYTEYRFNRWRDVPGILMAGTRLSRQLCELEGAVGVSGYTRLLKRTVGSVSVWKSEADLRRFVALPYHIKIMRRYRTRGSVRSATWPSGRFALAEAFQEGRRAVAVGDPSRTMRLRSAQNTGRHGLR
jgi:hypothetical protein